MSAYSRRKRAGKVKKKPPANDRRPPSTTPKPPPAPDAIKHQAPLLSEGEIRRLEREESHRRYIEGLMRREFR